MSIKHPKYQQAKRVDFNKYWHEDGWIKNKFKDSELFDYSKIDSLIKFEGDHPQVMQERIEKVNWKYDFDPTMKIKTLKGKILAYIEKKSGFRVGDYKNYKIT